MRPKRANELCRRLGGVRTVVVRVTFDRPANGPQELGASRKISIWSGPGAWVNGPQSSIVFFSTNNGLAMQSEGKSSDESYISAKSCVNQQGSE